MKNNKITKYKKKVKFFICERRTINWQKCFWNIRQIYIHLQADETFHLHLYENPDEI